MSVARAPWSGRRRTFLASASPAVLAAVLSACSLLPTPAPAPVVFDFGLLPSSTGMDPPTGSSTRTQTSAPPWLDSTAMLYRLAYADGTRLASYRDSRWAAPPAALLHERLRQRLARTPGAAGAVTLRIELEEFSQIFDSPASSRAVVRLRAELVEGGSGRVLRQQTFAEEVPAASADAPGGARALTQATDAVLARLIHWTAD